MLKQKIFIQKRNSEQDRKAVYNRIVWYEAVRSKIIMFNNLMKEHEEKGKVVDVTKTATKPKNRGRSGRLIGLNRQDIHDSRSKGFKVATQRWHEIMKDRWQPKKNPAHKRHRKKIETKRMNNRKAARNAVTESGRTEFDVGLGLSSDRVRHQTVLPNAQTKDRVRHLRQNLSLRLFKADRVRRKITDTGPSPTSNAHYQTHRLRTESVVRVPSPWSVVQSNSPLHKLLHGYRK
ncbi:hypothetical protein LXL04_022984 [Taraxacum kok-saghyz]